jgi:anti-sigma B factor antagonist
MAATAAADSSPPEGRPLPTAAAHSGSPSALEVIESDLDGVRIVTVCGDLDLATAGTLCSRVQAACRDGRRRLLLDLTRLDFCDSQGLRALIGTAHEVAVSAGRLAVVPPDQGAVSRLFALTGAGEFLPLRATLHQALTAV